MACMATLKVKELPRGKVIRIFLDISKPARSKAYAAALFVGGSLKWMVHGVGQDEAWGAFDDLELMALESTSWKAVLARLTGRREDSTRWNGSAAQVAAQAYGLGTWEWIRFLVAYRNRTEELRRAA